MVDYSKWKDIEISDDEDETHPNIDTSSLFRWRHQARLERMEEQQREKEEFKSKKEGLIKRINDTKQKLNEIEQKQDSNEINELKATLKKLEIEEQELKKKEDEIKLKEKITPWNVDTISNPGFTKTVINKPPPRVSENLSEEEREQRMKEFVKKNEKLLKQYGMLRKFDDSKRFLLEHPELVCEDTANYLVIWCINLEMEEKKELAGHVAHQCICMQFILELSKQLDVDPRACVGSFFTKIQVADPDYKAAFEDEIRSFKERVSRRAKEKLDQAIAEAEEEERKARLGPGGLDPIEVLESLPEELRKCFEAQDIPLLQETIAKMPQEEACYHMKRCVDSGLWIPDANKKDESTPTETTADTTDNVD